MKRASLLIGVIFFLALTTFVSATTTCSPSFISTSYVQGSPTIPSTTCSNSGNDSITISKTGTYFNIDQSVIGPSPSQKTIIITFDSNAPTGTHTGSIDFSDGSSPIPILFAVSASSQQSSCSIDIFPTTLTGIKIQQGETKSRTIKLSVPSCYGSAVTIGGISLASDEQPIQLGEISTGTLQPGTSVNIPLEINAVGVSTGSYQDTLQFLLYNSTGNSISVPIVNIGVQVTTGIQPITNFSFTELPTCSLSAIEMNLNTTNILTCTRNNPNIEISPVIDPFYLKGVSVDESSTQYIYRFNAKNIGNTIFKTLFLYKGASLGDPFSQ